MATLILKRSAMERTYPIAIEGPDAIEWAMHYHVGEYVCPFRGNVWPDDTTPRTERPVRFLPCLTLAGQYPGERPFYPSAIRPIPLAPRN